MVEFFFGVWWCGGGVCDRGEVCVVNWVAVQDIGVDLKPDLEGDCQ
jgi:hypothetical protein